VIKYALRCSREHSFEGWFSSSDDFDHQKTDGQLSCPVCGSTEVDKALMAPAILKGRASAQDKKPMAAIAEEWNEAASKAQAYVKANFEHVGKRFPEEARRIHYGETKDKPIWGEATVQEVAELREEGVSVSPVPVPVPDKAAAKKKMN
jgi:hypothetical protein